MTTEQIMLVGGIAFIAVGLIGGQIRHKDTRIPKLSPWVRAGLFGVGLLICIPEASSHMPQRQADVATGTIVAYWGKSPPPGWLVCDGAPLPAGAEYDSLRRLVGDRVPDLRGVFLRGLDPERTRDTDHREIGHYQADFVGSHTHPVSLDGGEHSHTVSFEAAVRQHRDGDDTSHPGAHSNAFNLEIGGGGHSHAGRTGTNTNEGETRPKNVAVVYIVKL